MIRVAIIDDHVVVRAGLRYIIEADPELEFVGDYGGGVGAVEFVLSSNPDVVLLDVRMPDRNGIDTLKDILRANPKAKVVMLTTSDVEEDVFRAIEEGALGYVMKESDLAVISAAIRSAMAGEVYMTDDVRRIYETRKGSKGLSAREAQVLKVAATGANNKEIAKEMSLSENSVKMFLKRAFFKLGAANRAEAVQLAVKRGLIESGFTLIELLIVVVVIVTLMSMVFRLSSIGDDSARMNRTVDRIHRLENALSGYYAAFGTYPQVRLHGSNNPFLPVNGSGVQDGDGSENQRWGWLSADGKRVTDWEAEWTAWEQARAACRSQPVACEFPFADRYARFVGLAGEAVKKMADSKIGDAKKLTSGQKRLLSAGFDAGVSDNGARFSPYRHKTEWSDLQLFRFGVMSYLLPRYLVMMNGPQSFFSGDYWQWRDNNETPADPFSASGDEFNNWEDVRRKSTGNNQSDIANVANIPSQAACARWMANFENALTCDHKCVLFGINVQEDGTSAEKAEDVSEARFFSAAKNADFLYFLERIHSPGGYSSGGRNQYMLDRVTVQDGWGEDLYYYSPPPYQSYTVWSSGPNRRTFPPWISREKLDGQGKACVGYWVRDDVVGIRH